MIFREVCSMKSYATSVRINFMRETLKCSPETKLQYSHPSLAKRAIGLYAISVAACREDRSPLFKEVVSHIFCSSSICRVVIPISDSFRPSLMADFP